MYITAHQADRSAVENCEPQEARITDEFRFAIDDLENVVTALADRLNPALRSDYPPETVGPDCPPVSALRNELMRLHVLSGVVRQVIDRLEV